MCVVRERMASHLGVLVHVSTVLQRPEKGMGPPETEIIGSCELPEVSTGN